MAGMRHGGMHSSHKLFGDWQIGDPGVESVVWPIYVIETNYCTRCSGSYPVSSSSITTSAMVAVPSASAPALLTSQTCGYACIDVCGGLCVRVAHGL